MIYFLKIQPFECLNFKIKKKTKKNTFRYLYLKYEQYNFRSLFQLLYLNIIQKTNGTSNFGDV